MRDITQVRGTVGKLHRVLGGLVSKRALSRRGRGTAALVLAPVLAVGVLTLAPTTAFAAIPEARTPLVQGPFPYARAGAVFGSTVVWDTQRSTNGGSTWVTDPALAGSPNWDFVGGGTMVSATNATTTGVVVYTPGSGSVSYPLSFFPYAVNGSYATSGATARNFATGVTTPLVAPTGATVAAYTQQLSAGNAILWHGSDAASDLYAAAPNLTAAPGAWVQIPGVQASTVTDTDFLSVVSDASGVKLCKRPVTAMTTVTCVLVVSGDHISGWTFSVTSLGTLDLVQVMEAGVAVPTHDSAYVVAADLSAVNQVTLPAGSSVGGAVPGGSGYLLVRDANSVPTVQVVAANGTLSAGFAIPSTRTVKDYYLAVAPDRVVGGDPRDGSPAVPVWTRSVTASGFGAETVLPRRASGVLASAARTAIIGRDGVSMYDRGALTHTFADAATVENASLSGPYVTEQVLIGTVNERTLVWKADGTFVTQYTGTPSAIFGSQYVETSNDIDPAGSKHVVVHDLTGVLADAGYTLPVGTAGCGVGGVWGTRMALSCYAGAWAGTVRVYDYKTGALVGTAIGESAGLGDGYVLVSVNDTYTVWNLTTNALDVLPGCHAFSTVATTDGVGHVVCQSPTELIWRDYSSLSTSAGRVLGWIAPSVFPSGTWTPQIDVTKAFSAGTLRISLGATVIRDLPVAGSADGSVRGVSWDGKDASGAVVPAATYTATLLVSGLDGSGAVTAIDGTSAPTFDVLRGTPGAFAALSPSRLLDTRDGTGVSAAGAVAANGVVNLQVTGRGGVPSAGVGAVILNVTAVTPASVGYLTVYPTGGAVPNASNLNFTAGQVVPNLVVAKVGTGGKVTLRNASSGTTHILADVAGYFADGTVTEPGGLAAVAPERLLDTRNTGVLAAGGSVRVQAAGVGGVPASGVSAVVVNLTAVSPAAAGFLTAYPTGGVVPNASNVNFSAGQVVPNLAFVKLAGDGSFTVKNSSPGATHVVADVAGYVLDGAVTGSGMFVPLAPARVLDTRPAYGGSGAVGANAVKSLAMTGVGGVPASGVSGVVLNVTAVASAGGFLTVYPADVVVPNASNVNFTGGQVVPNLVAVKLSGAGVVAIRNGSPGSTNVIADVAGYFTS